MHNVLLLLDLAEKTCQYFLPNKQGSMSNATKLELITVYDIGLRTRTYSTGFHFQQFCVNVM
jgi:hypothetical protein